MTALLDVMAVRATGDPAAAVVDCGERGQQSEATCDVLVAGGGTGGIAAALAAARAGRTVCLLEETDWIGGQLTTQGVSALDEHEHIERFGGTRSYYALRETIRGHYRRLSSALAAEPQPNPGHCWVTRLAFEPRVAVDALRGIARSLVETGRLSILTRTKVANVEVKTDRVESVLAVHLDERRWIRIRPRAVIDATELGDLLPLVGAEHVVGAETKAETGEPHAQPVEPKPHCVQSFTYTFVLENTGRGHSHVIPKPERYEHYRDRQPYSLRIHVHGGEIYGEETRWLEYQVLDQAPGTKGGLWTYRRLIDASLFPPGSGYPNDISMINWPGNDYRDQSILDRSPLEQARALQDAKRVSLGFLYWLQAEAPRPGAAPGFPELKPRPDVFATEDALGKHPYIRECRRLRALRTILEHEVSAEYQRGARAHHFEDSVGVGWYPIDIHNSGPDDVGVSCRTRPFQIPLGALIPVRVKNLLAGAKNLGTTHITNGCYRLHPVEWNTGEAAGVLAAFALEAGRDPAEVHADLRLRHDFQRRLVSEGIPLYWFTDVGVDHPAFAALQMAAVRGEIRGAPDNLEAAALSPTARARSVSLVLDRAVARLTLERPEALNALNRDIAAALEEALGRLEQSAEVSVVTVAGRGRAFCAGNDITEMPTLKPAEAKALSRRWQRIMDRFARLPQVTIAAVHGYALGGGCMLAAAQDLRIAETGARFGLPEVTLGFNPSYGIARLLDIVGGGRARDLLLTGRSVDAAKALRMGLVTRVVPDGTLERAAAELAAEIACHPRAGLTAIKAIVSDIRAGKAGGAAEAYASALRRDAGARARIAAFLARKKGG